MRITRSAVCFGLAGLLASMLSTAGHAASNNSANDSLGVIEIKAGAPIAIGGFWPLSGVNAAFGGAQERAVALKIHEMNGELLGHPLELMNADTPCTTKSGATAASKLAAVPDMVIAFAAVCAKAIAHAAPMLWKAGIVTIGTRATAPALTAADRPSSYDGFVRTAYDGEEQGISDAHYLYNVVGRETAVAIIDTSPRAEETARIFAAAFTADGGKVLSIGTVSPNQRDLQSLLAGIANEKPAAIYIAASPSVAAHLLQQAKKVPALGRTLLYGSSTQMSAEMIHSTGAAIVGYRVGYPDVSANAMGKNYPRFIAKYERMFGEPPTPNLEAAAYDGATLAFAAIKATAKADPHGNLTIDREALRNAVFAAKFAGVSGPIACDQFGQCAGFRGAVYQYTSADPGTFGVGANPKRIWP